MLPRPLARRLWRFRPVAAVPVIAVLALALGPWPAAGGRIDPHPWPGGKVTYYDASGSPVAVDAAARRWNRSGARVLLTRAERPADADVVFVVDRARLLRERCGPRCLALSSSIGRPPSGHVTVWLDRAIAGRANALSVWVAMHELGHVLGLQHRGGTCSLMNAQAYDKACAFPGQKDAETLPCGPASGDVQAAASLYGREPAARPCR